MEIFAVSRSFPKDERYSLTDQIRRSSRSVAANIAEGYRKRQYPNMFASKLADADAEATETQVWLDFALHFFCLLLPASCLLSLHHLL
jgi:four helix bundle protein